MKMLVLGLAREKNHRFFCCSKMEPVPLCEKSTNYGFNSSNKPPTWLYLLGCIFKTCSPPS